jgi:signal transduction histidine kinase
MERFFTFHTDIAYTIISVDNKNLWFWTTDNKVYSLDLATRKITTTIDMNTLLPAHHQTDACVKIIEHGTDELWLLFSERGLIRYNKKTRNAGLVSSVSLIKDEMTLLNSINDSIVLFGIHNAANALNVVNTRTGKIYRHALKTDVVKDAIISGDNVLIAFKENTIISVPYSCLQQDTQPLITNAEINLTGFFLDLHLDRSGVLWAGTDGAGFYKSIPNYRMFRHLKLSPPRPKLPKSIFTQDSLVYACSYNNYIDVVTKHGRFVKQIKGAGQTNFISIAANTRESETAYWLMGEECFGIFDLATGRYTDVLPSVRKLDSTATIVQHYCAVHKTINGDVYAGFKNSLYRLIKDQNTQYNPHLIKSFGTNRITFITSRGKSVAFCTVYNLYIYHPDTDKIDSIFGMRTDLMKCLEYQNDTILWAGTENGLYRCDLKNRAIRRYDEKDGLPNAFIYGIILQNGHLWMSTNKGLSCYSIKDNSFRNYTIEDGLQSNEFNTRAFHLSSDGNMYFGGPYGLNGFHDTDIKDNPFTPQIQITGIKLFDEPLKADSAVEVLSVINLPYNRNTLSFEFAALEFSNQKLNRYAYMMEGLDESWIVSGNRRFARYANLAPGTYHFLVKASNNNDVWTTTPKSITVIISPPFWQNKLFIAGCLLALISIIIALVTFIQKRRFAKKLRQIELQQKIQHERERISRDLHDNVGAQISYLVSNIDWITQHEIAENEKRQRMSSLSSTAKNLMSDMRETIWALNKPEISFEEFTDKLKSFALRMVQFDPGIKFQSDENLAGDFHFAPGEALNIFRICQEAITNAIKHSGASSINLKTESGKHGRFSITIADNGIGFPENSPGKEGHYGLENMKQRALESGVDLTITSKMGSGTQIVISRQ